jgi:hypothetical protein
MLDRNLLITPQTQIVFAGTVFRAGLESVGVLSPMHPADSAVYDVLLGKNETDGDEKNFLRVHDRVLTVVKALVPQSLSLAVHRWVCLSGFCVFCHVHFTLSVLARAVRLLLSRLWDSRLTE